jgi:hypothetical protein
MNKFEYYGLFVKQEEKDRLKEIVNRVSTDSYKEFLDHLTLLHRKHCTSDVYFDGIIEYYELLLGEDFPIVVNGIGISDKAIAFRVSYCPLYCANVIPHITIGTFENGKPVDSNKITNWIDLNPFVIHTTLGKKV